MTQVPPTLDFKHNTDLKPADSYLGSVAAVRSALRFPDLIAEFERYDAVANSAHRSVHRTGMVSLWLGGLALVGITAELLCATLDVGGADSLHPVAAAAIELCAVASILLAIGPWFAKTRTRWLAARFMAERFRQWHFQMLLDGALVSMASAAPAEFEAERARRWIRCMEGAPNAEGAMNSFVDSGSLDLHHTITPYKDRDVAQQAFRAYADLRFQKQLFYFRYRRDYFSTRDGWSEAAARSALFLALLLSAVQLVLLVLGLAGSRVAGHPATWLSAAALVLVVLSACIRVYRSAEAVSEQRERYETKWVRLVALKAAFDVADAVPKKLAIMGEVEVLTVEELREFLRQMRKASYLL